MQFELKCGATKGIVETRGGELVSFNKEGKEYIWNGDPAYWTGRNPNLFPVVGNLKNGKILIGEKEYEMGRHGFARNSEFAVAEQGDDYVVFELCEIETGWKMEKEMPRKNMPCWQRKWKKAP